MITAPLRFAFELGLTALLVLVAIWYVFIQPSNNSAPRVVWRSLGAVAVLWLAVLLIVASDYKP